MSTAQHKKSGKRSCSRFPAASRPDAGKHGGRMKAISDFG
ncbi:hypothetical protein GBL_1779 [Geobacillus kaustophilus GBlys]|uniref:Uncharacterized protein n=1 Tax=Geobacillus kaustophilus GBlys TaxID=1337888 RepID=U2X4F3_GEOKU|nr:hypothetical protein GBL_1779 [Geobacillus kaustophilus GBlys]